MKNRMCAQIIVGILLSVLVIQRPILGVDLINTNISSTESMSKIEGQCTPDMTGIIGDSIVTGYGLDGYPTSSPYSFANQVVKRLGIEGTDTLFKLGIDGITTTQVCQNLGVLTNPAVKGRFEKIVVSLGGNDVLGPLLKAIGEGVNQVNHTSNKYTTPGAIMEALTRALETDTSGAKKTEIQQYVARQLEEQGPTIVKTYTQNMTSILDGVIAANPQVKIYMLNYYNPFSGVVGYEVLDAVLGDIINEMNTALNQLAIGYEGKVVVVDIATPFQRNALLLTNIAKQDVHPNQAGHGVIAEATYNAITEKQLQDYQVIRDVLTKVKRLTMIIMDKEK